MTNRDRLRLLGEALHGPLWQNAVARDLGVGHRQVQRWVSGEYMPPDGVIRDLIEVAVQRQAVIASAIEAVQA